MINKKIIFLSITFVFLLLSCSSDDDYQAIPEPEPRVTNEIELLGGETTIFNKSPNAFGFFARNLSQEEEITFGIGNSLFNQSWVTAPASTTARDGLGPLFNARSCSGCHFKDGRGAPPEFEGEKASGLLVRLSVPGTDEFGNNLPEPVYGGQLQDNAILGINVEGDLKITTTPILITYPDGEKVTLFKPEYSFANLKYGAMSANVQISPRVANHMVGLGLLDAIAENDLLQLADVNDSDTDGISGKPNYVYDVVTNSKKLGRFGWKANQPNLKQQVASAFAGDLGITSSLFPQENYPFGVDITTIASGGSPELIDESLDKVTFYSGTLAVPIRRNINDPKIITGKKLFEQINCTACHIDTFTTGDYPIKALGNQKIHPYTDLLLHDMGKELADNTPDFEATGTEWRTPPLWGIGLIEKVNGHTRFMHDGRARNFEEAILWHGGEAETSKNDFMNLKKEDRNNLILFLESL